MALTVFGNTFEVERAFLAAVSKSTFLYLGRDFEANLRFVSENRIKELNRHYRNIDKSTDVLSFKLDEKTDGGDIVICYKYARKQSKKWHMTLSESVALLLVHGLLHLAGYDHEDPKDRDKMEKAEDQILAKHQIKITR